eukprot:474201_1
MTTRTTIGDRVKVNHNMKVVVGVVRFIGKMYNKPKREQKHIFYGIELEKAAGTNYGTYDDMKYFKCTDNVNRRGIFVKKNQIIQTNTKRNQIRTPVTIGDKVMCIKEKCKGVIKFIGTPYPIKTSGIYYGIALQKRNGVNNGIIKERKYFDCKDEKHGIFLTSDRFISIDKYNKQLEQKPLCQFSVEDVCHQIEQWIYNDIKYKNDLRATKKIFIQRKLNGEKMEKLSAGDVKAIIKNKMLKFMTKHTLNIILEKDRFDIWKRDNMDTIKKKTPQQIAHILFHFPLKNLLATFFKEDINGIEFVNSLQEQIIQQATGFKDDEIYQIESMMLRHHTFTRGQFKKNMNNILSRSYNLFEWIKHKIHSVFDVFDVENVFLKIKNGNDTQEFSDAVIDMVDEIIQSDSEKRTNNEMYLVSKIYSAIAESFIFHQKFKGKIKNNLLDSRQHWVCNNCSNCNVNNYIANKMN